MESCGSLCFLPVIRALLPIRVTFPVRLNDWIHNIAKTRSVHSLYILHMPYLESRDAIGNRRWKGSLLEQPTHQPTDHTTRQVDDAVFRSIRCICRPSALRNHGPNGWVSRWLSFSLSSSLLFLHRRRLYIRNSNLFQDNAIFIMYIGRWRKWYWTVEWELVPLRSKCSLINYLSHQPERFHRQSLLFYGRLILFNFLRRIFCDTPRH